MTGARHVTLSCGGCGADGWPGPPARSPGGHDGDAYLSQLRGRGQARRPDLLHLRSQPAAAAPGTTTTRRRPPSCRNTCGPTSGRRRSPPPCCGCLFRPGTWRFRLALRLLLGRDPAESLVAAAFASYENVSRRHATVTMDDNGHASIRDENSTNGTFVNGDRVLPGIAVRLADGDIVRLAADVSAEVMLPRSTRTRPRSAATNGRSPSRLPTARSRTAPRSVSQVDHEPGIGRAASAEPGPVRAARRPAELLGGRRGPTSAWPNVTDRCVIVCPVRANALRADVV